MKKIYLTKIATPALLAMLLAGGVSNLWGAEGQLAREGELAALAKEAEAARVAHAKATEKLKTATTEHQAAKTKLKEAQAGVETHLTEIGKAKDITPELTRAISEAKTSADLEKLSKQHAVGTSPRNAIEKAMELKAKVEEHAKAIAEHKQTMEKQQAKVEEHAATLKPLIGESLEGRLLSKEEVATMVKKQAKAESTEAKPAGEGEEKKSSAKVTGKTKATSTKELTVQEVTEGVTGIVSAKDSKERSQKTRALLTKLGGAGGIAGIIAAILGTVIETVLASQSSTKEQELLMGEQKTVFQEQGDLLKYSTTPNPNPKADPNDEDYNKTLAAVVALFSNFDQDLKDMLEKSADYAANFIQFQAGQVEIDGNQVTVSIRWDMEQSELGMPLTPVLITLSPDSLRGFALTPADILGKMDEGHTKDALALILSPSASLIFTIKLIQLYNLASKTYQNNDLAQIEYMLDEVTKLYSRFILSTDEDTSPDALNSYLQQYPAIVEVLNNKNVKIYKELVDAADTAPEAQNTAFMNLQNSELYQGPLLNAINIFYNHFYQIYYKKFPDDGGYVASRFTPGVRATKNMLQAFFYRGLKDVMRAVQELQSADGQVTLRNLDGTTSTVDPKTYLNTLIAKPSESLASAANTLKSAVTGIRKIIDAAKAAKTAIQSSDMQGAKDAYEKAVDGVKTASGAASDALLKFRKKFAPYYPLTWDDGTSLTPAEFITANIKALNGADPINVKNLIAKIYTPFSKDLGLSVAQLLPQPVSTQGTGGTQGTAGTQGGLVSKVTGYVTGAAQSLGIGATTGTAATTAVTPATATAATSE